MDGWMESWGKDLDRTSPTVERRTKQCSSRDSGRSVSNLIATVRRSFVTGVCSKELGCVVDNPIGFLFR